MKRIYSFELVRQPAAAGLNYMKGTVEARDMKDAKRQVGKILAEYVPVERRSEWMTGISAPTTGL